MMNASGGFRLPHGSERVFFIVDGNYLELLYWGYNKLVCNYLRQPYHLEPPTRQHPNKFWNGGLKSRNIRT